MDAAQLGELSKTLLRRATTGSLQDTNTTDAERALLASGTPPITGRQAQDYVAWRRAILWVSGIALLLGLFLSFLERQRVAEVIAEQGAAGGQANPARLQEQIADVERQWGKGNLDLLDTLGDVQLFVNMVVVVLVLLAARGWTRVSRSRHLVRWAWVISLFVPLIMAAIPWVQSMDFQHLDQAGQLGADGVKASETLKKGISMLLAFAYLVQLAPKVFSIFPGIMRSALTMKALLPESMQTGWMTALTAPLYLGFLLLALCAVSQMQGGFLVMAGFICLAIAPCVYLHRARDLLVPHPPQDADRIVREVRRRALVFNLTGFLLLVIYVLVHKTVDVMTLARMALDTFGGVLLTMVAFSDLLLALLKFELQQSAAFAGSALEKSYQSRLEELGQTGLTDIAGALRLREQKTPSAT